MYKDCIKNTEECLDKKSTHYFMVHMTQKEWEKLCEGNTIKKHQFNMIKRRDKNERVGKS